MKKFYVILSIMVLLPICIFSQSVERYGVITTRQKTTSVRTCTKDGIADMIFFWPPTFAFQTGLIITDTNNIVLRYNVRSRYNFEGEEPGVSRVYGLTYIGIFESLSLGKHIDSLKVQGQLIGITNNYVTVTKVFAQAGEVTTLDGSHEAFICLGDNHPDVLEVKSSTSSKESYVYALTDKDGIILELFKEPVIKFQDADESTYYVYGISYSGELKDAEGQSIDGLIASTECYQISTSRITVHTIKGEDIKPVVIDAEADSLFICTGDSLENMITVKKTAESFTKSGYIVTNPAGKILGSFSQDTFNFASFGETEIHVYALGYYGDLKVKVNESIGSAILATQCYELSLNYIVVQSLPVTSSTVSTPQMEPIIYCAGDGVADILVLNNSLQGSSDYLYVVTDTTGKIIFTQSSDSLDLESIPVEEARVSGVSYNGVLNEVTGQALNEAIFTDQCFVLADNFITVKKAIVEGGKINFDGPDEICLLPGGNKTYVLTTTSRSEQTYFYIVQNEEDQVLEITDSTLLIDASWKADSIFITGISIFGELPVKAGDTMSLTSIKGCIALSSNTIGLNMTRLTSSPIAANGMDSLHFCLNDDKEEFITLTKSISEGLFSFVLLDKNQKIIDITNQDTLATEGLPDSLKYIIGINYSGSLPVKIGEQLPTDETCLAPSSNRITITTTTLADYRFTSDRGDSLYFCANTTVLDSVNFEFLTAVAGQDQRLVLVDGANQVLAVSDDQGQFTHTESGTSNLKIRGIAYTGQLNLKVGDKLDSVALSSGCYKIISKALSVFIGDPNLVEGGTITSDRGASWDVCVSDGIADVITLSKATSSAANYSYVVTSSDGIILSVSANAAINFEGSGGGLVRIYGLSHANPLPNVLGNSITSILPIGCYNTSINFVTVNRTKLEDFNIKAVGDTSDRIYLCNEIISGDTIYTQLVGTTGAKTGIILSTVNGRIVYLDTTSLNLPLSDTLEGVYNLWGFVYSGVVTVKIGDNVAQTPLASLCYNRSRVPLQINISAINGGEIALTGNSSASVCFGNGVSDVLSFNTTGAGQYAYIITDESGKYLSSTNIDRFNFEGTITPDNYRVYGLSYTGDLSIMPGTDILTAEKLASGCFMLSTNFISIPRYSLEVGRVLVNGNDASLIICKDSAANFITLEHEVSTGAFYGYVIASPDERVIAVYDTNAIDFNTFPAGLCFIYGLTYDGNLLPVKGQLVNQARFSDGCWKVTSEFIEVIKAIPDGGMVELTGADQSDSICVGDGNSDRYVLNNNSTGLSAYQYFITDTNNVILAIPPIPVYDFESTGVGINRVWGAAFTGSILAQVGETLGSKPISSDCYDLSDNFATVTKVNSGEICGIPLQEEPVFQVTAYPVPVTSQLSVWIQKKKLENIPVELRIFDPYQKVWLKNSYFSPAENFSIPVNVEELKKGIYLLEVRIGDRFEVIKFLKY